MVIGDDEQIINIPYYIPKEQHKQWMITLIKKEEI